MPANISAHTHACRFIRIMVYMFMMPRVAPPRGDLQGKCKAEVENAGVAVLLCVSSSLESLLFAKAGLEILVF